MNRFLTTLLCASAAMTSGAQKIDFDMTGRQTAEVTETGYQSWQVAKGLSDKKTFTTDAGGTVDIEINCGDGSPENRSLRANWSKNIVQKNSKLIGDAVVVYGLDSDGNTPQLTSESATMNILISGLTAGRHSLLLYLNATDGNLKTMAPIDVLVDGQTAQTGVEMSNQATAPSASAFAYVTFNATEGATTKVSLVSKPTDGTAYSTTGIYVNALVFDEASPSNTALDPYPANEDMHVDADNGTLHMTWTAAEGTVKNLVYMGTSKDAMQLMAETDKAEYDATALSTHNTYYWRVDERDASGTVYQGDTWTFRPRRLAFPGAEGYGRYAIGGRGGAVYHVTSLEDYADSDTPIEGTLRYGLKALSGPRTIVFDIAGTIHLKARLTCSDKYVTIAGQTAPGKGILLRGAPLGVASDGITRFIRNRRGFHNDDEADINRGLDGLGMAGNDFAIMDHCSVGWTIDEAFSSRNAKNITLQRTLISETLNNANHPNYTNANHGYSATIGGDTGTYHHNLLAHNEGRNWSLSGGLDGRGESAGHHDIFNNVVYNWGGRATDGGTHECNFVNNYYKMGPATSQKYLLRAQLEGIGTGTQSYYVSGNIRENTNGSLTQDAQGTTYRYETSGGKVVDWTVFVKEPFFPSYATIESAELAFKTVLSDVGASQPVLDDHDKRMVSETFNGTYTYKGSVTGKKGLIDRETDAGGYESFPEEKRAADFDTDGDGMPDWWEKAAGSNPAVADNNAYSEPNGYTALEKYLNWIAEPHYTIQPGKENEVLTLKDLFAGFKQNATYTISANPQGITLKQTDGKLMATATEGATALNSISVTATDGDNKGSMTRTVNLYVEGTSTGIVSLDTDQASQSDAPKTVFSADGTLIGTARDLTTLPHGIYILRDGNGNTTKFIQK